MMIVIQLTATRGRHYDDSKRTSNLIKGKRIIIKMSQNINTGYPEILCNLHYCRYLGFNWRGLEQSHLTSELSLL